MKAPHSRHPSEGVFRLALRLLPAPLRERAGDEMLEMLRARLDETPGRAQRLVVVMCETAGVMVTAVHARRPDRWTRH